MARPTVEIFDNVDLENACSCCGCTESHGCAGGCWWIDVQQTICSACAIACLGDFIDPPDDCEGHGHEINAYVIDLVKAMAQLRIYRDPLSQTRLAQTLKGAAQVLYRGCRVEVRGECLRCRSVALLIGSRQFCDKCQRKSGQSAPRVKRPVSPKW